MAVQGPDVGAEERQWGPQSGSFRLSISSDRAQYTGGTPIIITAVLKNVTDHPTRLVVTTPVESYSVDVRIPMPSWIPWKPQAIPTALNRTLAQPERSEVGTIANPGHERITVYEINKLYDMSTPGEYRIIFSCRQPLRQQSDPTVHIVSNEIVVAVLSKKE